MSDQQPRPRYGEYAPGGAPGQTPASDAGAPPPPAVPAPAPWTAGSPSGQPAPGYAPPVRKRSTADVIVTVVLLVLGLGGTLVACIYGVIFADPQLLDEGLRQQGRGSFTGQVGQAPAILIGSHVVLYLIALGVSIASLVRKRITFWIPLVIGVIAAVIFWVTVGTVLASDPSLMQQSGL